MISECVRALNRVRERTGKTDERMLRLHNYKMTKKDLERNRSERNIIVKVMMSSVKQIEMTMSSIQSENRLLQEKNKVLVENNGDEKTVAGKNFEKSVKRILTRFVSTAMCISR